MREKILSLLSTLEKGEKADNFKVLCSFLLNENGQPRPWVSQALESLFSSVRQLVSEVENSFPTCSEKEVGCFIPKGHGNTFSSSQVSQDQSKTVLTEKEDRKEEFIKLLRQNFCKGKHQSAKVPHIIEDEGQDNLVSTNQVSQEQTMSVLTEEEITKEECYKLIRLALCKGKQKLSEGLLTTDNESRTNKLLMLIRQAISKGESVLYDASFLEQCENFLHVGYHEDTSTRIRCSTESTQDMDTGMEVEELHGDHSAEMEVKAPSPCGNERERNGCYGPLDKRPPDKEDGTVSGSTQLPMQKEDCRAEKGVSPHAEKGGASDALGVSPCTYANILKFGKIPPDCPSPSRVNQPVFTNSLSHHIVTCMGDFYEAPPAGLNVPLQTLGINKSVPTANNASFATSSHVGSEEISDSSKEDISILKIDNEILNKRMSFCQYSIIGKVSLAKGDEPWTVQKLRSKLEETWKLHSAWRLIGLGKGFFQILLLSQEEWDKVWARGMILLKPGTLRLQRWSINFDPLKEKMTNAQVWFRIYQLPWGLWDPNVISGIANKVGVPLKIDNATLNGDFGYFARVLVEVDMSTEPISEVQLQCGNHIIKVKLSPENLPSFCNNCHTIGHCSDECRHLIQKTKLSWQQKQKRGEEPDLSIEGMVCSKTSKTDPASLKRKEPILFHDKAGNEVECMDEILGSNRAEFSMDFRIVDVSIMKEALNVMGNDKQVHQAPDNRPPTIENLTCTSIPISQKACKGGSNNGKSVCTSKIESPNRFSALSEKVDEDVIERSITYITKGDQRVTMSCSEKDVVHPVESSNSFSALSDKVGIDDIPTSKHCEAMNYTVQEIIIPKLPEKWGDIMDEEEEVAAEIQPPPQEVNTSTTDTSSKFERTYGDITGFRAKLHDDCLWLNHDNDFKYDRDMCVVTERYKNSAKETRNFIANLPKQDKKVKIAFRQTQRKACSPKE